MRERTAARDALLEAIALRTFPPTLSYPEQHKQALLSTWLTYPTFTWAPECLTDTRKPSCVVEGCSCTPAVKEYTSRMVHDIEHKTVLYYARYTCTGVSKGRSFSTIDDEYISSSKVTLLAFPYLLTYKSGVSVKMFDLVYDSMMTTKGIAGATHNVTRRRQKRFYHLLALAATSTELRRIENPNFSPPLLPTIEQFMTSNGCIDEESLQQVWLAQSEICSRLLEAQMAHAKCSRVIRIDHSQKFCSKLKVFGPDGEKEQSSSVRMLFLVQNEVGQIVSRGLTRSENHEESAAILQSVVPKLDLSSSPPLVCVCDNANQTRGMVDKVFGGKVLTKQDPFHVIQRLTEKLSEQSQRKALSKQLSRAMYDVESKIRAPDAMAERFLSVLSEVQRSSIRVSIPVWENCIAVNAEQIRAGDLFVEENEYLERGKKIRVVSTSQLEAVHSKLRKLLDRIVSIEVGMRILDIFLLQHNLKTGAKFKRNPSFAEFDFVAMCQTAVICRGVIPDSPQLEFIHELLAFQSTPASVQQRLRPGGDSAVNRPWERVYGVLTVSTASVEASMLRKRAASSDIRQLLTSVHVSRKLVSQEVFVQQLGLEVEYESTAEFSSNEFSLLEQIRKEQLALDERTYWWRECVVVTTVLYNASVRQLDNPSLKLRKRCFRTIDKYLATIDAKLKAGPTQSSASSILRLKLDEHGKPNDDVNSEDDECLQKKLFNLLRVKSAIKKRTQVFCNVFDLAGCLCASISRKTKPWLMRRWTALRTAENRIERMKIVLRVPPDMQQRAGADHCAANSSQQSTLSVSKQISDETNCSAVSPISGTEPATNNQTTCSSEVNLPVDSDFVVSATDGLLHPSDELDGAPSALANRPATGGLADGEFEVIDEVTREHLRQFAAAIPRSKGKWTKVLEEYAIIFPATKLSAENLRCRLKETRKARKTEPLVNTPAYSHSQINTLPETGLDAREASETKKRPACQSCRDAKRKCGVDSRNLKCQYKQHPQRTMSAFFNISTDSSSET